jgi:uncharacterized membrane protein
MSARLLRLGLPIFALAIIALGVETVVCAHRVDPLSGNYRVVPVIPWVPAIPRVAYLSGAIWVACGIGLLAPGARRTAGFLFGSLFLLCTLLLDVPKYAEHLGDMSLRTAVFEPISLACIALLIAGRLTVVSRYLLALSLIVFGVDHFLALVGIGNLLPAWIPWHLFWVELFGAVFIVSGLSVAIDYLRRPGLAGLGLMFAIWVLTLHLPRVLGLYGVPGAPRDPNEWSSFFIAVALWGGPWALACATTKSR